MQKFSNSIEYSYPQYGTVSGTVLDDLHAKHPEACLLPTSILPSMNDLPYFEDVEVTGSHEQSIAHQLQGGAGPGGCDASHWRDVLL